MVLGSSTRVCYIDNESAQTIQSPCFRETGDIANINEKGIFYVNRKNHIIKRFGHRVNLTKVEETICNGSGFINKCIWSKTLNKLMVFILMPENYNRVFAERILDKLRVKLMSLLPEANYPDYFEIINKFPLTSHGKLDQKFLEDLYLRSVSHKANTTSEQIFSELWCKYLGFNTDILATVEQHTFTELGGNSINALQMTNEFREILPSECPDEILGLVLQKKFEECISYLKNYKKKLKTFSEVDENVRKKAKLHNDFNIFWTYNMKACVDSSPLVFEHK